MKQWLAKELIEEVKKVFNPKYGQQLSDEEALEIGNNLVDGLEVFLGPRKRTEETSAKRSN